MGNPIFRIAKSYHFDSAHYLPNVEPGHKCGKMHGHTYKVTVEFRGTQNREMGWLIDYGEISSVMKPLIRQLDHQVLNEIDGLQATTAEELCLWFWDRVRAKLPSLFRVIVQETPTSQAEYRGEMDD